MTDLLDLLKQYDNQEKVLSCGAYTYHLSKKVAEDNGLNVKIILDSNLDSDAIMLPGTIEVNTCEVEFSFSFGEESDNG